MDLLTFPAVGKSFKQGIQKSTEKHFDRSKAHAEKDGTSVSRNLQCPQGDSSKKRTSEHGRSYYTRRFVTVYRKTPKLEASTEREEQFQSQTK